MASSTASTTRAPMCSAIARWATFCGVVSWEKHSVFPDSLWRGSGTKPASGSCSRVIAAIACPRPALSRILSRARTVSKTQAAVTKCGHDAKVALRMQTTRRWSYSSAVQMTWVGSSAFSSDDPRHVAPPDLRASRTCPISSTRRLTNARTLEKRW
jgi:hypothetical protein